LRPERLVVSTARSRSAHPCKNSIPWRRNSRNGGTFHFQRPSNRPERRHLQDLRQLTHGSRNRLCGPTVQALAAKHPGVLLADVLFRWLLEPVLEGVLVPCGIHIPMFTAFKIEWVFQNELGMCGLSGQGCSGFRNSITWFRRPAGPERHPAVYATRSSFRGDPLPIAHRAFHLCDGEGMFLMRDLGLKPSSLAMRTSSADSLQRRRASSHALSSFRFTAGAYQFVYDPSGRDMPPRFPG